MKTSHTCPKCQSRDVIRVPGTVGAYGSGNNIALGLTLFGSFAKVTRFVCGACGFSEEWIDEPGALANLKKKFGKGTAS